MIFRTRQFFTVALIVALPHLAQPAMSEPPVLKTAQLTCLFDDWVDCNGNGRNDYCEIQAGTAEDCDHNLIIDECEQTRTFQFGTSHFLDSGANSQTGVVMGDFNGDGLADLATADGYNTGFPGTGRISIRMATGPGTYAPPLQYTTTYSRFPPKAIAKGDIDHDGDIDLVFNVPFETELYVMRNNGSGIFDLHYPLVTDIPHSDRGGRNRIVVKDLNRDGTLDIAFMDVTGGTGRVVILINTGQVQQGQAVFALPVTIAAGSNPFDMTVAKLRPGNAPLDLITANFGEQSISIIRLSNGVWSSTEIPMGSSFAMAVASADFTGDGLPDVAVQTYSTVKLLTNLGGTLGAPVSIGMGAGWDLRAGDLDGDGVSDLAVIGASGTAAAVIQRAPGVFEQVNGSWSIYNGDGLELLDINHDNKLDFVIRRIQIYNRLLEFLPNLTQIEGPQC